MQIRRLVVATGLAAACACGGSQFQQYSPTEVDVQKKSASFADVLEAMQAKDLRILEEDEPKGILSTQWEKFDGKHYNVQVLLSPVSAVVNIGCRIEKSMEILDCPESTSYPKALVKLATELTEVLR